MTAPSVEVRRGETLLAALTRVGRYLEAPCGGEGRCRRCRVRVEEGPVPVEGPVLACRVEDPGAWRVVPERPVVLEEYEFPRGGPGGGDLGLAVDLGTTTVAAELRDLGTGMVLGRAGRPNPQIAYGADVMSRLRHGLDAEHRERLAGLARHAVGALLATVLSAAGRSVEDLRRVRFAGNASMSLLYLGRDPARLARAPFEARLREEGAVPVPGAGLGLGGSIDAALLPALGGHVGGDTTAGILAAGLLEGPRPALLVDLGTNGEVALATRSGLLVASAAAGPAFEGGGLSHGSPARPGAIERVDLSAGSLVCRTVDGGPPRSFCGSGALEAVAALREAGIADATGRIRGDPGLPVPFDQGDVREVQLAKGALAAAQRILLAEAGVATGELRRVVLTGAFGARLRAGPARRIGLVPAGVPAETLEGGALAGAAACLGADGDRRAAGAAALARHVPLGDRDDFQDVFVECLALEEAVA